MRSQLNKNETFVSLNGKFSEKKTELNFLLMTIVSMVVGIANLLILVLASRESTDSPAMILSSLVFVVIVVWCFLGAIYYFKEFRNRGNIVLSPDSIQFVFKGKVLKEVRFEDVIGLNLIQRSKWHSIKKIFIGPYRNLIIETRNQGNVVIRELSSNFPQVVNHIGRMTNREFSLEEQAFLLARGPHHLNAFLSDFREFPKVVKDWQTKLKREGLVPHELLPYVKQEIKNWDKL